jgi:hypothetical protein
MALGAGGAGAIPKTAAIAGRGYNAAQIARAGGLPAAASATLEGSKFVPGNAPGQRAFNAAVGGASSMGATALMPAMSRALPAMLPRAAVTRAGAEVGSQLTENAAQDFYPDGTPKPKKP